LQTYKRLDRRALNTKWNNPYQAPSATTIVTVNGLQSDFEVSEWWPYANKDGDPVFNASTGELLLTEF
jgi:hypothetical protein